MKKKKKKKKNLNCGNKDKEILGKYYQLINYKYLLY